MKAILLIISLLIVYGSLYPFNFVLQQPSSESIQALFNFNIFRTDLTDLIANIVLFIPFGILVKAACRRIAVFRSTLLFLAGAFIFAYAIQVLQLFTEDRIPWGGDAVWNVAGCSIGLYLHSLVKLDSVKTLRGLNINQQISITLALTIIALEFAPFAPSIDFDVLKENVKMLINAPSINTYWLLEHTVFWLVTFFLLRESTLRYSTIKHLCVLVIIVLSSKFIIISSDIDLAKLLGGGLALFIWYMLSTRLNAIHLSCLLLITIVGNGLYPFDLRAQAIAFNWLPFSGSMSGNLLLNILAFMKKLVFYGGVIWLLCLAKRSLVFATLTCVIVVIISEILQTLFENSIPESTDIFLCVFIAFVLAQILRVHNGVQTSPLNNIDDAEATVPTIAKKTVSKSVFTTENDGRYIRGLDGLRAVAALSVFFVHFQQFTDFQGALGFVDFGRLMTNGNTGVALFFVLSGFLLSIPFWHGLNKKTYPNIKRYMVSRIVRIVPIYYLCLFTLFAFKGFQSADVNFNNILSHLFFLHNLKDHQVMSLNPPFWTLAVEFQFYLLLPLLFLSLCKLRFRQAQTVVLILIPTVYFAYRYFMHQMAINDSWPITVPLIWPFGINVESPSGASLTYSLFAHLPHFLIGLFAASFYKSELSKGIFSGWFEAIFWLSTIAVFVVLATEFDETLQLAFGRYNFPFVPILLGLIVFSAPQTKWASRLLELTLLKWLGVISYGLYIFHYPIQNLVAKVFAKLSVNISEQVLSYALITLALTIMVSHLSFRLIERPVLLKFKGRRSTITNCSSADTPETEKTTMTKRSEVKRTDIGFKYTHLAAFALLAVSIVGMVYLWSANNTSVVVTQAYWAAQKSPRIIFDHHTHSQYSDGSKTVSQLTELAYIKGCDAFAITDHSQNPKSLSHQKLKEIREMRDKYPVMLIFAGMELGMPSYHGREHVNLITTPEFEDDVLFGVLKALQSSSGMEKKARDLHVLAGIDGNIDKERSSIAGAFANTVAIYNHPSRKDENKEGDENYSDVMFWNQDTQYITSLSGAPGHQRKAEIGSYEHNILPIDRWDPAVAVVGGTWDKLLQKGQRVWGALASSDYHGDAMDYGPCEFARIHVASPDKTYGGLIRGIKEGTFWADHGKLLKNYDFTISVDGSKRAHPGGTITLTDNEHILAVEVIVERNIEYENDFLRVDVISNCSDTEVTAKDRLLAPETNSFSLFLRTEAAGGRCFVRSRVVRETPEEHDLSAYSNPIFVSFE